MKKIALILTTILIFHVSIHGQTWETIGSGVADFLLSNPKTADKMKPEHQVALSIIGNLLNTSGQRKHELNVANAGRTQMNFNTNSGQQIQLVMDANGSVYALSNGIIYPISQNIVNEAKDFVLNEQSGYMDYVRGNNENSENTLMLQNYSLPSLRNTWNKEHSYEFIRIPLAEKMKITELMAINNLRISDIYKVTLGGDFVPLDRNYISRSVRPRSGYADLILFGEYGPLYTSVISTQFRGLFSAKWVKDLNNNGIYEFEEFEDKRRNFYQNESFVIAAGFYSRFKYFIKLSILDQQSGRVVSTKYLENNGKSFDHGYIQIERNSLNPGIYVYNISFINSSTNEVLENVSDKFQILSLNQTKEEEYIATPTINQGNEKPPSKEDMINELIQLLKEGKISEETFKISMKAIEGK